MIVPDSAIRTAISITCLMLKRVQLSSSASHVVFCHGWSGRALQSTNYELQNGVSRYTCTYISQLQHGGRVKEVDRNCYVISLLKAKDLMAIQRDGPGSISPTFTTNAPSRGGTGSHVPGRRGCSTCRPGVASCSRIVMAPKSVCGEAPNWPRPFSCSPFFFPFPFPFRPLPFPCASRCAAAGGMGG